MTHMLACGYGRVGLVDSWTYYGVSPEAPHGEEDDHCFGDGDELQKLLSVLVTCSIACYSPSTQDRP